MKISMMSPDLHTGYGNMDTTGRGRTDSWQVRVPFSLLAQIKGTKRLEIICKVLIHSVSVILNV